MPAPSLRRAALAFAAAYDIYLFPLLLVQNPPLHDYMFHIARIHILAYWQASPDLQAHHVVGSFLLPSTTFGVVAVLLAHVMPLELAGCSSA